MTTHDAEDHRKTAARRPWVASGVLAVVVALLLLVTSAESPDVGRRQGSSAATTPSFTAHARAADLGTGTARIERALRQFAPTLARH